MRTIAVYPGSFDPPTYGHLDIIERSARVFSRVIVAVARNIRKNQMFTTAERMDMLRKLTKGHANVEVDTFRGLLVEHAREIGAHVVIRGLRAISDFEYEFQMALMNKKLSHELETFFMMPSLRYIFLSSSVIKEVASFGGNVADLVPPGVAARLAEKFGTGPRSSP